MQLVFATHNQNKFKEVQKLIPTHVQLLSLTDIGCHDDIPETGSTLSENARLKADYVAKNYALPCFADDTGLLVDVLNGAPGIYSARYAGAQKNAEDNMNKLLAQLEGQSNRSARFTTIIALRLDNEDLFFEGSVAGEITLKKNGTAGFGYDPIFRPSGYQETFAQLPLATKNKIGHRGKAIQNLLDYLKHLRFNN